MEKPPHPAIVLAGGKTLLLKTNLHRVVNGAGGRAAADFLERNFLAAFDSVVKFLDGGAGAAPDDVGRDVAEITGRVRTWKNINDARLVRVERAVTAFVRIAALPPAGDDGVGRESAGLQDGGVNHGAQQLGGQ